MRKPEPLGEAQAEKGLETDHQDSTNAPNISDATNFLSALSRPGEHITLQTFDDSPAKRRNLAKVIHAVSQAIPFAELERLSGLGAGVFVTVNETDGKGRKAANVRRVRAVFLDLDGSPLSPVRTGPLAPSCVIESSSGKFHVYWFVADLPLEEFKAMQQSLAARFDGDPRVHDLPRVMRLPGFAHQKTEQMFVSRILELHHDRLYTRAQLLEAFPAPQSQPQPHASVPLASVPLEPALDPPGTLPSNYAASAVRGEIAKVSNAPPGTRNDVLNTASFNLAMLVASGELPEDTMREALAGAALNAGLSPEEARATIDSGFRAGSNRTRDREQVKGGTDASPAPLAPLAPLFESAPSELDAANLFAKLAKGKIKYVVESKKFFVYDAGIWCEDGNESCAWHQVYEVAKLIRVNANSVPGVSSGPLLKLAARLETSAGVKSLLEIAARSRGIVEHAANFDRDDWKLNLANGTLDLRTLELREHNPSDLLCLQSPVSFDPTATAPRWTKFLEEILPDSENRAYLQRYIGACLTGSVRDQVALFCYGPSAENGKSTLLTAISKMLGTYGAIFGVETLLAKTGADSASSGLADLAGKRFCWASESPAGHALNEAIFKNMVSGEPMKVRHFYGLPFTMQPRFKIVVDTNFLPVSRDGGHGVFRRQAIMRFDQRVSADKRDGDIHLKLEVELSGILNWAITGLKAWQAPGGELRNLPDAVRLEVETAKEDADEVLTFIRDRCSINAKATFSLPAFALEYNTWARERAAKTRPMQLLAPYLCELGCKKTKDRFGRAVWSGLSILSPGYIPVPTGTARVGIEPSAN